MSMDANIIHFLIGIPVEKGTETIWTQNLHNMAIRDAPIAIADGETLTKNRSSYLQVIHTTLYFGDFILNLSRRADISIARSLHLMMLVMEAIRGQI